MYLVINKCVTAVKFSNFSCHYLRKRSTLDIGIVQHKEHSLEVLSIPPGTPCIYIYIYIHTHTYIYIYIHRACFHPFYFFYRASNLKPQISNLKSQASELPPCPSVRTVSVTSIVCIQKLDSESCE